MKKARIGIIGAGAFVGGMHLITAAESEIMEISAIADINEEVLKEKSDKYEVGYTTTDYKKILNDPEIDIVVIGLREHLHAQFIIESLDAGKWVFCEKPMAVTEEETKAVLEAEKGILENWQLGTTEDLHQLIRKPCNL